MTTAELAELEATEYLLGLDALDSDLGRKGAQIWNRCATTEILPRALRQKSLKNRWERLHAPGDRISDWNLTPSGSEAGTQLDAELAAIDVEIAAAWGRCLEQLKILWLTDGPRPEVET